MLLWDFFFFFWCGIRRCVRQRNGLDSHDSLVAGSPRCKGQGGKREWVIERPQNGTVPMKKTCFTITWKRVSHLDFLAHNCPSSPTKRKMDALKLSPLSRTSHHNVTSGSGTWLQWQNVEIGFLSQLFLYKKKKKNPVALWCEIKVYSCAYHLQRGGSPCNLDSCIKNIKKPPLEPPIPTSCHTTSSLISSWVDVT